MRSRRPVSSQQSRALWARTNHANRGFKDNTPDGWVDTNGPVWWYGDDKAYLVDKAGGVSAITKATSIIVNRLAATKWGTTRGDALWLTDPMNTRGDDRRDYQWPSHLTLPRSYFYGQWIRSALLYGMGYFIYRLADEPMNGSFLLINPANVEYTEDDDYPLRIVTDTEGFVVNRRGRVSGLGGDYRLVTLRNPLLPVDYATGRTPGVLEYHALELGLQATIAGYTSGVFTGSGVPSGYLKNTGPQLTPEKATALKQEWLAGQRSGRTVAILSAALEYSPVAVSPLDAQLADITKLSLVSVANAFCVPLFMLGAPSGDSMTYSNVEMEEQALWTHTLYAWQAAITDTLNSHLPYGTELVLGGNGGNPGRIDSGNQLAVADVPAG